MNAPEGSNCHLEVSNIDHLPRLVHTYPWIIGISLRLSHATGTIRLYATGWVRFN
jgi:hypothetical protein